jgi:hypothetical protein
MKLSGTTRLIVALTAVVLLLTGVWVIGTRSQSSELYARQTRSLGFGMTGETTFK